jgi:hypothetical protein
MTPPYLFELDLASYQRESIFSRKFSTPRVLKALHLVNIKDKDNLVDLFSDAFSNYHAKSEQARIEIGNDLDNYFAGTANYPLLNCSWGYWKGDILIGACLLSYSEKQKSPFLDCIAVRKTWKSRNISSLIFQKSIFSLIEAEQLKVYTTISESNWLPLSLAERIGFIKVRDS